MPRHFKSFRAHLVSSALACAAVAVFPGTARAVPYSVVETTWGYTASTAILGKLTSDGGIGATTATGTDGATVYVGNTTTATSGTERATITLSGATGNQAVTVQGTTVFQSNNTTSSKGTYLRDGTSGGTDTATFGTLDVGGSTTVGRTGNHAQVSSTSPLNTSVTSATGVASNNITVTSGVANLSTLNSVTNNGGVQGFVNQIATTVTGTTSGSGNADYACNGTSASCVTSGGVTVNAGRNGYYTVHVTGALTTNLILQGRSASDYVFVYLDGGIGTNGRVSIATLSNTLLQADHVIVVLGATSTLTAGLTTVGTYLLQSGYSFTVGSGSTINGGVFISNNSTTTASELIFSGNATIQSNPWNGWIAADAPEPMSMAMLGTGLLGLVGVARRRRGAVPKAA